MERLVDNLTYSYNSDNDVRKLDNLGRVVIPRKILKRLKIEINEEIEYLVDNDKIVIKKYKPKCIFCHDINNIIKYKGKIICEDCFENLKQLKFNNF